MINFIINLWNNVILLISNYNKNVTFSNESNLWSKIVELNLYNDITGSNALGNELENLMINNLNHHAHYRTNSVYSKHLYHTPAASKWPILLSLAVCLSFFGLLSILQDTPLNNWVSPNYFFIFSFLFLLYCANGWFSEVISEAVQGHHTIVVSQGIQHGFVLFLISEFMLFFGFFWAFLHCACGPSVWLGGIYPPVGIATVDPYNVPLLNTCLLITSGLFLTVSHKTLSIRFERNVINNLLLCIILGILFLINQVLEYYETPFSFFDSIYGCSFYMLTGLHGCHVIIGLIFLIVGLVRFLQGQFFSNHYLGFVLAIWYWHFVDIVWILLYFIVYYWFY